MQNRRRPYAVLVAVAISALIVAQAHAQDGAPVQPLSPPASQGSSQLGAPQAESLQDQAAGLSGSATPAAPAAVAPGPAERVLPEIRSISRDSLPHDLSPIGMFMAADWVVKGVMLSLAFASFVTWTVGLAKTIQLFGARMRVNRGMRILGRSQGLAAAFRQFERAGGPVSAMVRFAENELRLSDAAIDHAGVDGVKERIGQGLSRIEARAGRQMSAGTGVLATIGSTAPFVGLFGTVWGIMNSFIGISQSQTTNLAVVAPGIAEALLATAIGLVAAIPAVIIYNVFARAVTGYRQSLADAAAAVERLVSRDLDYRKVPGESRGAKFEFAAE